MSEAPQNETNDAPEDVELSSFETNDSVVESETTTQVEGESNQQVDEVEIAKQKANDAFNKQYGEKKQLERELKVQQEENARFQEAERARQAALVGNIPDMPDPYDDDFDEKSRERDAAIIAKANFDAQNQNYQAQLQQQQQQTAQAQQAKAQELQTAFTANAKKVGATDDEFNSVIKTLNVGGITREAADAIMSLGEDGYFIAKHLAANPAEAHEFNTMNPILAGAKLVELRQKAGALKPRISNTPNPGDNLQGRGADPDAGQYKYIGGSSIDLGSGW